MVHPEIRKIWNDLEARVLRQVDPFQSYVDRKAKIINCHEQKRLLNMVRNHLRTQEKERLALSQISPLRTMMKIL